VGALPKANLKQMLSVLIGFHRSFRVEGDSMEPTLHHGDRVTLRRTRPFLGDVKRVVQPGDVVVLRHPQRPDSLLVKRLWRAEGNGLYVRGDNESASTDSSQFGQVPIGCLWGVVEAVL